MRSEGSSLGGGGGGGGVWKSGDLEIWEFGDLGTWKSRNLGSNKSTKIEILKIQIRAAQKVGKVWVSREKSSWPYLGPSEAFFSWTRKIQNVIFLHSFRGGPMGPIHPVWALAAIHPKWGNRYPSSAKQTAKDQAA